MNKDIYIKEYLPVCIIACVFFLIASCKQNNHVDSNTPSADFSKTVGITIGDIVDSISINPLESSGEIMMSQYNRVAFDPIDNIFTMLDKKMNIFLFSEKGKFISHSANVKGDGPNQYSLVVDASYNSYTQTVDLLNPYGDIYKYDTNFRFIEKISYREKDILFKELYPLSQDHYLMIPTIIKGNEPYCYFMNYKTKEIEKQFSFSSNTICRVSMNVQSLYKDHGKFLFSPNLMDYHLYEMNLPQKDIYPIIRIDLGDHALQRLMNKSYDDQKRSLEYLSQLDDKALASESPIPLIKLLSEKYIYLHVLKNGIRLNYIYDRKREVAYSLSDNSASNMYFCVFLDNNVLTAIVQPYEISKYVSSELLSDEDLKLIEYIDDSDNPIIVRYYLKE